MPVLERLAWITRQVAAGRSGHISLGSARDRTQLKAKIVMEPMTEDRSSSAVRRGLSAHIALLRHLALHHPSVDRGHGHSSGRAVIAIWFRLAADPPPDASSGDNGDDGHNPHGHDDADDPWVTGGDPWSQPPTRNQGPRRSRSRSTHTQQRRGRRQQREWRPVRHDGGSSSTPNPPCFGAKVTFASKVITSSSHPSCCPSAGQTQTSATPLAARAERERQFHPHVLTLDTDCWRRLHRRFPIHRDQLAAADARREMLRDRYWWGSYKELYPGDVVQVEDVKPRRGRILRSGFHQFEHDYRVQFEDNTDQWVKKWLCKRVPP